jgi:soluble lytic murein transglycosylase
MKSGMNAYGAMQLKLGTARGAAKRLRLSGIESLNDAELGERLIKDTRLNRQLGTEEIRYQLDKFGGDQILALAAYNAGRGRVLQWLANERIGDPRTGAITYDEFLRRIPSNETRKYVHDVLEFSVSAEVRQRIGASRAGFN